MTPAHSTRSKAERRSRHRFPLLVGISAFRVLAIPSAVVLVVAATFSTIYVEGPDLPNGDIWRKVGFLGPVLAVVLFISPLAALAWLRVVGRIVRDAVATRASDVELGADGFAVLGGRAAGFTLNEAELRHAEITWSEQNGLRVSTGARALAIPIPRDASERASLRALFESLCATKQGTRVARPKREPAEVVHCRGCGAPLAPSRAARVVCGFCNESNTLPQTLVERVLALDAVHSARRWDERQLRALLRQPGATLANAVVFVGGFTLLAAAFSHAAWLLLLAFTDGLEAGLPRMPGVGPIALGLSFIVAGASLRSLASRSALRVLTIGLAAEPPDRPGEPHACRECGGPLPELAEHASLATCVYCRAVNVRAVEVRPQADILGEHRAPSEVLRLAARRRRIASALVVFGALLLVIGVTWRVKSTSLALDRSRAVTVPFERVRSYETRGMVEVGQDAAAIERVQRFDETVLTLLSADRDRVDVVAMNDETTRVFRLGDREPRITRAARIALWSRMGEDLVTLDGRGVVVVRANGADTILVKWRELQDPLAVELSAGPGDALFVTTRASPEGHLRLRELEPGAGVHRVRDDAREIAPSADGARSVVTTWVDDRWQLAMFDGLAESNQATLLTQGAASVGCPTWSPDGRAIAFLSETVRDTIQFSTRYGRRRLYALNLEDRRLSELTAGGNLEETCPVWTDDGIYVVASEQETPTAPFRRTVLRVLP
ncbi:MAG: hypothetical protein U0271_17445 [Polyangiaceae bacterium]